MDRAHLGSKFEVGALLFTLGALATSSENAVIPQWAVALRNRRITVIPQILSESRCTEFQHWETTFFVFKISNNLDTNLPLQKSKLVDILKTIQVVPLTIAQCWISVLRDSERISGITVMRRFRNATAHSGITAVWLEVARAPCHNSQF